MKTTYKRETVLDKHSIKSCRACAVNTDIECCSPCVDSDKSDNAEGPLEKGNPWYSKTIHWSHISCKKVFNLVDVAKTRKDARKIIINGRNSELIDNVGTPKKFYVLQMLLHLMRPKSSKSFVDHTLHVAMLPGYSFEPRPYSCVRNSAGLVMIIRLSKNGWEKPV